MAGKEVNGVLLLYHRYRASTAPTIMEYVDAFSRHSRYPVYPVNTDYGFPSGLSNLHFSAIVLHYSLFGLVPYHLNSSFMDYLKEEKHSYKAAIFQDEYHYCQPRFAFIDEAGIDCVYSCYDPQYYDQLYYKFTRVPRVIPALTGYVSDEMIEMGKRFTRPFSQRGVDVSYRGRELPFYNGRGGREKVEIAQEFLARARGLGLKLDIEIGEDSRIYGDDWYRFLADSKAVLGVESGVSLTDIDDTVRERVTQALERNPALTFDEIYQQYLRPYDGKIPVRTISPRHFEAATLRVCQVLFEGEYSGVLKPVRHYIPLRKDFSNFDEVIRLLRDETFCQQMVENAFQDLIASGRYSFSRFIAEFDEMLATSGVDIQPDEAGADGAVTALLEADLSKRRAVWYARNSAIKLLRPLRRIPWYRRIKPLLQKAFPWLFTYSWGK